MTEEQSTGNEITGKQSSLGSRLDLLPPMAVLAIGEVLAQGIAAYPDINGRPNWTYISVEDHLNHAMFHLLMYLAGDITEDHLTHAATRLLFAIELC